MEQGMHGFHQQQVDIDDLIYEFPKAAIDEPHRSGYMHFGLGDGIGGGGGGMNGFVYQNDYMPAAPSTVDSSPPSDFFVSHPQDFFVRKQDHPQDHEPSLVFGTLDFSQNCPQQQQLQDHASMVGGDFQMNNHRVLPRNNINMIDTNKMYNEFSTPPPPPGTYPQNQHHQQALQQQILHNRLRLQLHLHLQQQQKGGSVAPSFDSARINTNDVEIRRAQALAQIALKQKLLQAQQQRQRLHQMEATRYARPSPRSTPRSTPMSSPRPTSAASLLQAQRQLIALRLAAAAAAASKIRAAAASARLGSPTNGLGLVSPRKAQAQSEIPPLDALIPKSESEDAASDDKFGSVDDVVGQIYSLAKDQHGCRFLQRKFEEGRPEDVERIFAEVIDHVVDLMTDPFGNYLVQKLLDVCSDEQYHDILRVVTRSGQQLVSVALNVHGTRAVQKIIETLKFPDHVAIVTGSLKQGVVTLIQDLNGNHVVQKCLQTLGSRDNQFIFDAVVRHCVEIATHRHGCCVLQRCVDSSSGAQRQTLISEIAANALVLSQDQYGNYVVQYVLEMGATEVMRRLEGNYPFLAMQKFSSNVVEKCLRMAHEDLLARIIREIVNSNLLAQLLQDPFANYVIQCALSVTKGSLHLQLVDAIRPHSALLRSSPFGKRILSRINNSKK